MVVVQKDPALAPPNVAFVRQQPVKVSRPRAAIDRVDCRRSREGACPESVYVSAWSELVYVEDGLE